MLLCRDSAMNFFCFLLKFAAARPGLICLSIHYFYKRNGQLVLSLSYAHIYAEMVPILPALARRWRHLKKKFYEDVIRKKTKTKHEIIDIGTIGDFAATFASVPPSKPQISRLEEILKLLSLKMTRLCYIYRTVCGR